MSAWPPKADMAVNRLARRDAACWYNECQAWEKAMTRAMPHTIAVLEAGLHAKLHAGAQLFVALNDVKEADIGIGLSAPGKPMKADSIMTWLSCSKIATSIQFARIWQEGFVDLDDPVKLHLPEFSGDGKDAITIRHVWTHTCALLNVEQQLFPVRYNQSHAANIALTSVPPRSTQG